MEINVEKNIYVIKINNNSHIFYQKFNNLLYLRNFEKSLTIEVPLLYIKDIFSIIIIVSLLFKTYVIVYTYTIT